LVSTELSAERWFFEDLLGFRVIKPVPRQPTDMIRAAENPNEKTDRSRIGPLQSVQSKSVESESENSLIRQTRNGSHSAFAELIRRHQSTVRAVLGRYLRDDDEVDELAQRTFISAFRSMDRFRGDASFSSWLVAISRRQAAMYFRDESRRRKHETTAGELSLLTWTDASFDRNDDVESKLVTLSECLRGLPANSHDVVTRFYFERQSIDVIASSQGRSPGAIRMLLMRIRRTLAKCISLRLVELEGKP
jgi:RNA polymerase sigma-70 factor (ECF subfamily)